MVKGASKKKSSKLTLLLIKRVLESYKIYDHNPAKLAPVLLVNRLFDLIEDIIRYLEEHTK